MSARISASVYTSHVPAIGAAIDLGKTDEPYWRPLFDGYDRAKEWFAAHTPDVIILVYNDHATTFSLDIIPTFAIGTAAAYTVADEGGDHARCPTSWVTPNWRRTSPTRSSSRTSTSRSSTASPSITA